MSQCGDYEDINFYVINVFYGIVIAIYFLPFKKNHPVHTKVQPIRTTELSVIAIYTQIASGHIPLASA